MILSVSETLGSFTLDEEHPKHPKPEEGAAQGTNLHYPLCIAKYTNFDVELVEETAQPSLTQHLPEGKVQ